MRVLAWTVVVIFFVVYTFSIFGMLLIARPIHEEYVATLLTSSNQLAENAALVEIHTWTSGIDKFMYFLVNILFGDDSARVIREIQAVVPASWVYFYTYMAVGILALMNLITAIIVEHSLAASKNDEEHVIEAREAKRKAELEEMKALFEMMDENGDGTLSWEEFESSFADPEMADRWQLMDFSSEDCSDLFRVLDDGDGEIHTTDFFEGLRHMRGDAKSKDVYQIIKLVEKLSRKVDALETHSIDASQVSRVSRVSRISRVSKVSRISKVSQLSRKVRLSRK